MHISPELRLARTVRRHLHPRQLFCAAILFAQILSELRMAAASGTRSEIISYSIWAHEKTGAA